MSLSRDAAYIHYAANKARVQNAMKRLDESTTVLTEEQINQIILEEFNATELINKIKQIFTNMTNKFVEYTKKQIQNKHDPEYLKAIEGRVAEVAKGKNIPIEMREYEKGIANINNITNILNAMNNGKQFYESTKADNKDAWIANIQKSLLANYNPQGQIKFEQFCLNYFQGGQGDSQPVQRNTNNLDVTFIVKWCINFPNTLTQVQHDIDNLMTIVMKATQGLETTAIGTVQGAVNAPTTTTQKTSESVNYSKADIRHQAYKYKNILESIFNEAETKPADTKTAPPADTANANTSAQPQGQAQGGTTGEPKTQDAIKSSQDSGTVKFDKTAVNAERQKDANIGIYIGAIQNVLTTILNARFRSTNIIYNDYIKILQVICPRNEYMNNQQQVQQPAQPAAAAAQPQPAQPAAAATGQGQG